MNGDVSIVIPTRNRPGLLDRCLGSIDADVEIIVVDQSDEPLQAASLCRPVRLVRQAIPSIGAARTAGALAATAPLIAYLDDDVIVIPGWGTALAQVFASGLRPAAVFGAILPAPGPGLPYCALAYPERRRAHRLTAPWYVGHGGNMAIDRATLLSLGGFRELRPSGEDADMIMRLLRAGRQVLHEPEMAVLHERRSRADRLSSRTTHGRGTARVVRRSATEGDGWAGAVGAAAVAVQLRQMVGRDPIGRQEGRRYLRAFAAELFASNGR